MSKTRPKDGVSVIPLADDAEKALLGNILSEGASALEDAGHIDAKHFAHWAHQRVFSAILAAVAKGEGVEPHTVSDQLRAEGLLAKLDPDLIVSLLEASGEPERIPELADTVVDAWRRRELVSISFWMGAHATERNVLTACETIALAQQKLFDLAANSRGSRHEHP